jgi:hypothetical protein
VETRTPGAAGGPGKPTGSDPGRAPRSDPTEAVEKCVAAHRSCLAEATEDASPDATAAQEPETVHQEVPAPMEGLRAIRRRERRAAVHACTTRACRSR